MLDSVGEWEDSDIKSRNKNISTKNDKSSTVMSEETISEGMMINSVIHSF